MCILWGGGGVRWGNGGKNVIMLGIYGVFFRNSGYIILV